MPNVFSILGSADGVVLLDPNIDVFCAPEALPNKLVVELVVVAAVFVTLPNVDVCPYGGGGGRAEFVCPNAGAGDENAPKPADCVVCVPNCSGFVSIAGLLAVNVNALCVVAVVFVLAVLIFPNNGVALVVVAADPNVNTGGLVDVAFPNWKALVSRRIKRK